MSEQVTAERLKRRKLSTCPAGCVTFAYDLPVRLDEGILPFIQPFGTLAYPFGTTSILKLDCQGFTVTGIKRLKEIRIVLRSSTTEQEILPFEEALSRWLVQVGG